MKKINKVIAAMMIMAITSVPALANNKVDKKPGKDKDKVEMRIFDKWKCVFSTRKRVTITMPIVPTSRPSPSK